MSATKRTRSDSEMEMVESPPTKKRILFESSSNSQKSLNCSESMDVSSHSNDENKDSSNIIKENKENSLNKITTLLSTQKTLCDDILENMLDMESLHRSYTPEAKFLKYVHTFPFFQKSPTSHSHTLELRYRKDIVEWLIDICKEMRCRRVTLFTAVRFLDRVLQSTKVARDNLQLVAICSFMVAVKYEGPEEIVPSLSEASFLTQSQYDVDVIREVEVHILQRLNGILPSLLRFIFYSFS